ncbi:hypothetical protein HWV62_15733 [Athelia sp. TMB]|nr:hypothetical protein HWV62_15733 [Athelia sp. TMB]
MAPPAPVDINNLAPSGGDNHYVNKLITVMDRQIDTGVPENSGSITWTADVHVYPTGASLEDPSGWKRRGQVHVMIVHRGTISNDKPDRYKGEGINLGTFIKNPGAQPRIQLPPTNSGVKDGDNIHCAGT